MDPPKGAPSGGKAPQRPTVTLRPPSGVSLTPKKPVETDLIQSQTIAGDDNPQQEDVDSDDDTYNRRPITPTTGGDANPFSFDRDPEPSDRQKEKRRERSKRYTLTPGEYENEVILVDEAEDGVVLATIQTTQDFRQSAAEAPEEWCDALKRILHNFRVASTSIEVLRQQNEELGTEVANFKAKSMSQANSAGVTNAKLETELLNSARLRRLRDKYRKEADDLLTENERLKLELTTRPEEEEVDEDSDQEGQHRRRRRPTSNPPLSTHTHHTHVHTSVVPPPSNPYSNRGHTPATVSHHTEEVGTNKRYPDVADFHGDKDKNQWERWVLHLDEKFRQSAVLFPTERDKIGYIRDHCKSIAFEVIKTRANFRYPNPYQTAEEMITELDNMFGTYDKISESNAQLNDPKFGMGVVDKKESFETFYARFSAAIAPLEFTDVIKISNLTGRISTRLKNKLAGQTFTAYRDLVAYLRKLDLDLKHIDNTMAGNKEAAKPTMRPGTNRGASSTGKGGGDNRPRGYKYPKPLVDRIRKEGRCFKCLKPGHRSGEDNAPCKDDPPLNKEQVEVILKVAGVEDTPELPTTDTEN